MTGALAGRRILVTGAAQGIGSAIAVRLAGDGATLALLDRRVTACRELAEGLAAGPGGDHVVVGVDLAEVDQVPVAAAEAIDVLGGLDGLVNNAGIFDTAPLEAITADRWDAVLAVNTRAPLLLMQAAFGALRASGRGRIVNVTSMGAKLAAPGEAHYAASKAALAALTRAAALEWGCHGITANAVSPGYVLTDMGAGSRTDEDVATWSARSPLGRLGTPADVAGVVAFLLSDAAAYLTGSVIDVAGGMVMGV